VAYVDGFVIPVPTKNLAAYMKMSRKAGAVWKEHGALQYCECVGDDLASKFGVPFTKMAKVKPGETVVFSWIVYTSRAQRDRINAKAMKDPRIAAAAGPNGAMPFDIKRMAFGGFKTVVDL
jgi:uncharacterized protein YbaA (DUF1428 family)